MEPTKNFLGIPIDGEITPSRTRGNQLPQSALEPLIRSVLDSPGVEEFGWRQYTPYFNDGDPCEFGARGVWAKGPAIQPDPEYGDPDEPEQYEVWSLRSRLEGTALYNHLKELDDAIESNRFDNVLLDLFGDHAEVTVRRTGIMVRDYNHD